VIIVIVAPTITIVNYLLGAIMASYHHNSSTISERRAHNSKHGINKLPPELLSRIFTIGKEIDAASLAHRETWYTDFQGLITVSSLTL
jgi:hypothetical protein